MSRWRLSLSALCTMALLGACGGPDGSPAGGARPGETPVAQATHAGTKRCAACHAAEDAAWRGSPHAKQDTPRAEPPGGAEISIGSSWMQAYLRRDPSGLHRILPTCFDLRRKRWRSVGDVLRAIRGEPMPEDGPDRPLHEMLKGRAFEIDCAGCHTSGLRLGLDLAAGKMDATWREAHTDCESCHGAHAAHASGWTDLQPVIPGARLADLDPQASVAMCAQCHGGPAPVGNLAIADAATFVCVPRGLAGTYSNGVAAGQAYQAEDFIRSPCHVQGELVCTDCHDAHGAGLKSGPPSDTMCVRCHATQQTPKHTHHAATSEGARCIACHMPRLLTGLLKHQRDHRIGVPLPASPHAPDACTACHVDRNKAWAAGWAATWWGPPASETIEAIDGVHLLRTQGLKAAAPKLRAALGHPDPFFRWIAAGALGDLEAVVDDPVVDVRLYPLVMSHVDVAKHQAVLKRLVEDAHPLVRAAARVHLGGDLDALRAGAADFRVATRLDPKNAGARLALATIALADAAYGAAADNLAAIVAGDPAHDLAWAGLIGALDLDGRPSEASGAARMWVARGLDRGRLAAAMTPYIDTGRVAVARQALFHVARAAAAGKPLAREAEAMHGRLVRTYRKETR